MKAMGSPSDTWAIQEDAHDHGSQSRGRCIAPDAERRESLGEKIHCLGITQVAPVHGAWGDSREKPDDSRFSRQARSFQVKIGIEAHSFRVEGHH